MRIVKIIISSTFLLTAVLPVIPAHADKDWYMENPCEKREQMDRNIQKQQMKARIRQLMEEGMDMWVETAQLLKESASDPQIREKAAALEERMRANINEHKELHKKMHDMSAEHGSEYRHEGKGHGEQYRHGEKMHQDEYNPCDQRGMQ